MDETESGTAAMFDHPGWRDSPLYGYDVTYMRCEWNSWNHIMADDDGDDDDDDDVDGEMDETESGPTAWCGRRERPN